MVHVVSSATALGLTVATLAAFSALGFWYSRGRVRSVEDFLTARNSTGPRTTTATLVASVMGVWILLSPAEAGAAFGGVTAVAGYAVGEAIPMLAYARLGPRIRELLPEGHSLTEYALARYGPAVYLLVFVVSVSYMFVFLAAELTGITSALELVAGVPRWQTAVLVGGFVLLYTGYGGLRASIFTDTVQAALVIPLLVGTAVAALVTLGGPAAVHRNVVAADPSLLDPGFLTGLQFGFWVAIAVLGAELVNQTWWQRIYAARDSETLKAGFRRAAALNFVLVFVAGLFGVAARGYVDVVTDSTSAQYDASVAFFVLITEAFSETFALAVALVALLLVMSTADSLFNALASLVTTDLPRILDDPNDRTLTLSARALTVVVAVAAIYVSLRARSVLELFLLADLFGVAVAVPLLSGLYSERVTGGGALLAGVSSLAVGLAFFPNQLVRGLLTSLPVVGELLPTPAFLTAFVGTAAVSASVTALSARMSSSRFDHRRLAETVHSLDDSSSGYRDGDD
ncbi:Na+/proline symporter [Halopelagius inordinatus]|uniref:Na+/proline symporter n=1 Tax=Halopelagius inordinatus TaxID=553467 RepID=A0A1I2WG56_9EURY|nr:Na+/proline symporter [Halopelagius inordinatus]